MLRPICIGWDVNHHSNTRVAGNHPNIVGIVGAIIVYEPYCLVLEFVDGGDLLEFLQV